MRLVMIRSLAQRKASPDGNPQGLRGRSIRRIAPTLTYCKKRIGQFLSDFKKLRQAETVPHHDTPPWGGMAQLKNERVGALGQAVNYIQKKRQELSHSLLFVCFKQLLSLQVFPDSIPTTYLAQLGLGWSVSHVGGR